MNLKTKLFTALLAIVMLCSCSREGFEESLNRKDNPKGDKASASAKASDVDVENFIFDLTTKEYEEGSCLYYCDLPVAASSEAEDAVQKISKTLDTVIAKLADELADGREYEQFSLYNAITRNDGETFSVVFEAEICPIDGDDEEYVLGFVFNAQTGERVELKEIMKPETLVTLILDEQSSKVPGRKEEVVAKKRSYLSDCGEKQLTDRLVKSVKSDLPYDASYYIDGSNLVAAFSAIETLGEAIEVSVVL